MKIFDVLRSTGLPCAYGFFKTKQAPPYLVYMGDGQETFAGDNTWYNRVNRYRIEYYYNTKNEENENAIEIALLANGFNYDKSEDMYLDDEDVFIIYYYV